MDEMHRRYHEVADLFPLMQGDEYEALKTDIGENGQREPIWLHPNGSIIDGRNRHRACVDLGIAPHFETWNGNGSLVSFVVSLNLHRRHLSASQRAAIAVDILPMLEDEARERQRDAAGRARELSGLVKEMADASPLVRRNIEAAQERQETMRQERRVYFMRDGDDLKVGISIDPETRLLQIQSSRPNTVLLGHIAWHGGAESYIRSILEKYHTNGEWYRYDKNVAEIVSAWIEDDACLVKELTKQANEGKATAQAARLTSTNRQYVSDAKKLASEAPDLLEEVKTGAKSITQAKRELVKRQAPEAPALPDGKYRVLYADPPWAYGNTQPDYHGEQADHYILMTIPELCGLPVQDLAADNAVLFLWVTSPILEEAFDVIKAWGFKYKSSFVWDKVKHNMGHYNSVRHELLLICVRGSCQPDVPKLFDSVQSIERTAHSVKPEEFRTIIDTIYPHGKRIELFARRPADGWEVWGNESGS